MMSPRWGYWDVAPLGLLGCRPAGAITMSPRWGYCDTAPLGLLGCRPAGAIGIPPRWGYYDVAPLGLSCKPSTAEGCPFLDYAQNSGRGETLYRFPFHSSISFAILHVDFYFSRPRPRRTLSTEK